MFSKEFCSVSSPKLRNIESTRNTCEDCEVKIAVDFECTSSRKIFIESFQIAIEHSSYTFTVKNSLLITLEVILKDIFNQFQENSN